MAQAAAQQQGNALARIEGTSRNALDATQRMHIAKERAHLISPATSVGMLPEGCGIAFNTVTIDVKNDTYDVGGGKRGLSKTVLQKLAAALGLSWDPYASRRMDDGSDPYYCQWQAVGQYRSFDGQIQTVAASKEMDLRQGSPQIEALWQRYEALKANPPEGRTPKSPEGQIREMRLHIQAHAETKAQLRAIRSLGIKTAYTAQELQRPFVAARVMFTGETEDPQLRAMFAAKTADAFLGGTRALYGTSAQPAPANAPAAVPSGVVAPRLSAPPPVGSVPLEDDDLAAIDTRGEESTRSESTSGGAGHGGEGGGRPETSSMVLRFSKSKGMSLAEANSNDLEWVRDTITTNLETGDSRYPDSDKKLLAAVVAELDFRGDF